MGEGKLKKNVMLRMLVLLCIIAYAVIAYSILTYGRTVIHSDTATALLLSNSRRDNHSLFPQSWNYGNGEIWTFCILTFVEPFFNMLADKPLARMLGSLSCMTVCMVSVIAAFRKGYKNNAWVIALPVFMLFLYGASDTVLYQASDAIGIFFVAIVPMLAYAIMNRRKVLLYGIYLFLAFIMGIKGLRFIAEQFIPLFLSCLFFYYSKISDGNDPDIKTVFKKCIVGLLRLLLPFVAGLVFFAGLILFRNTNFNAGGITGITATVRSLFENMFVSVQMIYEVFGYRGGDSLLSINSLSSMAALAVCTIVVFVVPVLQLRRIRDEDDYTGFIVIYGLIHNAVMYSAAVFCDLLAHRYFLTCIYFCIIISSNYIYKYWICQKKTDRYVWAAFFIIASLLQCIYILGQSKGWKENLEAKRNLSAELETYGIEKAYATYWNAYTNEAYSNMKIRFGAVYFNMEKMVPDYFLVDNEAFMPVNGIRSCLILTVSENELFTEPERIAFFGTEEKRLVRDGLYIYIYDHDIAESFGKPWEDNVIYAGDMLERNGSADGAVEISEDRAYLIISPGGRMAAPIRMLKAGEYKIIFEGQDICAESIAVRSKTELFGIDYTVTESSAERVVLRVVLKRDQPLTELRLDNASGSVQMLKKISLILTY
ncbi:MAG: hypothetical protein K5987_08185 [Lachnospiraceae bacterium]|nr:hypothetical protein [Lachnospiraceae bacterium]